MTGFYGVMVSTLDFESSDPSSNLGGTSKIFYLFFFEKKMFLRSYIFGNFVFEKNKGCKVFYMM